MLIVVNIKFLLYMSVFLFQEALAKNEKCPGQIVTTYKREMMKANLDYPREFAVDKGLNTLYFSHGKDEQLAQIHLGTRKFANIESVESSSQSVNPVTHEVYIATEKNIYKYDPKAKEIDIVVDETINVASVFYYNYSIYFTERWLNHVHKVEDDEIKLVGEIQMQKNDYFVIDHNGTFFYTANDQLFSKNVEGVDVSYDETKGLIYRGLAIDNDGKVLACTYFGIFQLNKEDSNDTGTKGFGPLESIVPEKTRYCSGLATDKNNNIIYADGKSVFKLKKKTECTQLDNSLKHRRVRLHTSNMITVSNLDWTRFLSK